MDDGRVAVRLVFADRGRFHDLTVRVPAAGIDEYERLIDVLREDPEVLAEVYVDHERLVAAYVLSEQEIAAPAEA